MTAPAAQILRFAQLRAWSGLPERTLGEIIATGTLGGASLWPGGRRYFLREVARHVLLAAPLPASPFGAEPEPELLRICDVCAWTGLTEAQFRWIESHGLAAGRTLRPNGKRLYVKAHLRTVLFHPLLPAHWRAPLPAHTHTPPIHD